MAEWFSEKLNHFCKLNGRKQRVEVLTDIKIKLVALNANERMEIVKNLDLSKLFTQLTSHDREYVEPACDVLDVIFNVSEPGQILWHYTPEIYKLLSHDLTLVKSFALSEILRIASNPNSLPQLLTKVDLLTTVTQTVGDKDLGVAQITIEILKKIGKDPEGLKLLYSGALLRTIAKLLSTSDVVKFRVYEVVVDIAKNGKEYLQASVKSGFLQSLISLLDSDDVLLQLNVLEMITDIALTQDGLDYLEKQGVLQNLSQKIDRVHETPLSNLLIPGLVTFFGNVARFHPDEVFSKYPFIASSLFELIQTDDQILLGVALDTLGHISSTVEGKYALENLGHAMPPALKKLAEVIQNMPSQLRVRGLNNLRLILYVEKSEQDNRILLLIKSWFDCLCEEPLKMIVSLCKQPFADIRQASLEVLVVIASQEWGQEYIANYPGLTEFLLDRSVESFKECKEVKFEVVKKLLESVPNIFDTPTMQRFKQFVSEGPFHVDTITEIAIEGAS